MLVFHEFNVDDRLVVSTGGRDRGAVMASKRKRVECVDSTPQVKVISEASAGSAAEVGRLVDSSQADDRRMIALVRERPLLYARNNMPVASYYTQVKTLWHEVATEMGWTGTNPTHIHTSYVSAIAIHLDRVFIIKLSPVP